MMGAATSYTRCTVGTYSATMVASESRKVSHTSTLIQVMLRVPSSKFDSSVFTRCHSFSQMLNMRMHLTRNMAPNRYSKMCWFSMKISPKPPTAIIRVAGMTPSIINERRIL